VEKSGFWTYVLDFLAGSGMICLSFRDRFDILLEKRPNGRIVSCWAVCMEVRAQIDDKSEIPAKIKLSVNLMIYGDVYQK